MKETIDAGEGYRLLSEQCGDKRTQPGDELYCDDGKWIKATVGAPVGTHCIYRRKLEDRWIPLSERLPDKFPCWVFHPMRGVSIARNRYTGSDHRFGWPLSENCTVQEDGQLTHWKPMPIPDPPEPEVPFDEMAYYNWFDKWNHRKERLDDSYRESCYHAWLAALAWERGRK